MSHLKTLSQTLNLMINSIFTMAALSTKIEAHEGKFPLMYDEMSLLFKNIDKDLKGRPMRQIFSALTNGDPIGRVTGTNGEERNLYAPQTPISAVSLLSFNC